MVNELTNLSSATSDTSLKPNVPASGLTPINPMGNAYGFESINFNPSSSSFQSLAAGPNLKVETPNTDIVQNRMVFSTVDEAPRAEKTLKLSNTGDVDLTLMLNLGESQEQDNAVPGRVDDHKRAADFLIGNAQIGVPFTLQPGASRNVSVEFRPQRNAVETPMGITDTLNGENYASLTITSNDPDQGIATVNLAGLNAVGYEGSREPTLAEITRIFGYGVDIGSEHNPGVSSNLFGDEVYSPYWVRADASRDVELFPLAVYSSRSDAPHDSVQVVPKGATTGKTIYLLAGRLDDDNVPGSNDLSGGENQKLLPKIMKTPFSDSLPPTSDTVSFNPTSPFALKRGSGFTDDNRNGSAKTHTFRIYPLRDTDGVVVPNTWLVSTDIGTDVGRNGDYQDDVWLMKNARPEKAASLDPSRGGLVPGYDNLIYNFNKTYPGSLKDADGQSIGFTGVQLNSNDGYTPTASYKPALLDIDTITGTLRVNSTAGGNGSDNTLVNGLQTTFDSRAGRAMVTTKLLGSLSYLDAGVEQAGVMFGPNDDNYIKLVARALPTGGVGLEFYKEIQGVGDRMGGFLAISDPSALQSLELMLLTDPQARTVRAAYHAIYNTGGDTGVVPLSSFVVLKGAEFGHFIAAQSKAGILASHKGGTQFTATFDRFAVESNETSVAARTVVNRYDVGRDSSYTDPFGREWNSDTGLFTPADAISETGANSPGDIANTTNDVIYRTYRAKLGPGTMPLEDRVLSYNLPVSTAGKYDLRLHFAEIFFGVSGGGPGGIGTRVFDINVEGQTLLRNFDITAAAGGPMTAVVVPIEDIQVNDGELNLRLKADVNFGAISGIEVLQKV